MKTLIDTITNPMLLLALVALVVAGIKYGVALLDAKTEAVKSGIKNQTIADALWKGEQALTTAVVETAQTLADKYKEQGGGKLTPEQAAELKQIAIDRAKTFLSDDVMKVLTNALGDVEAWFEGKVEQIVRESKPVQPSLVRPNPYIDPEYVKALGNAQKAQNAAPDAQ